MSLCVDKWQVITNLGTVEVFASSEAQARSRAKWKAAHRRFIFRTRAEALCAVRDVEIMSVRRVER